MQATSSPIQHVPNEILGLIFVICIMGSNKNFWLHYKEMGRISLVCSHWKRAIEGTPILWARLSPYFPPVVFDRCLERAKDCSLVVRDWRPVASTRYRPLHSNTKVKSVIHRCRWLSLEAGPDDFAASGFIHKEAPLLECLGLESLGNKFTMVDIFRGFAPKLRELRLHRIQITPSSQLLTELRVLNLSYAVFADSNGSTCGNLLQILGNSPKLEALELNGIHPVDEEELVNVDMAPVSLPNLKTLLVGSTSWLLFSPMIHRFDLPDDVDIDFTFHGFLGLIARSHIARFTSHIARIIEKSHSVSFHLHKTMLEVRTTWKHDDGTSSRTCCLRWLPIDDYDPIGWIAEAIEQNYSSVPEMASASIDSGFKPPLVQSLRRIPNLRELEIHNDAEGNTPVLLPVLGLLCGNSDASAPQVRHLIVRGGASGVDIEVLKRTLEPRDRGQPLLLQPVPLERLTLYDVDESSVKELEEISRSCVVHQPSEGGPGSLASRYLLVFDPYLRLLPMSVLPSIEQVPNEVLSHIFVICVTGEYKDSWLHYREMGQISLVCSHWKAIIEKTPVLWTRLSPLFPPVVFEKCLKRSGECGLVVEDWSPVDHIRSGPLYSHDRVRSIVDRCRRLSLEAWGMDFERSGFIYKQAPLLEYLNLGSDGPQYTMLNPFRGSAVRLRELRLYGIQINPTSPLLSQLNTLMLSNVVFADSNVAICEQVLEMFGNCSNLENLELYDITTEDEDGHVDIGRKPVSLPRLKKLYLSSVAWPLLCPIMERLKLPPGVDIDLTFNSFEGSGMTADEHAEQLTSHIFPLIPNLNELSLQIHNHGLDVQITSKLPELLGQTCCLQWPQIGLGYDPIAWITEAIEHNHLSAPQIASAEIQSFSQQHLTRSLQRLPNLHELKAQNEAGNLLPIVGPLIGSEPDTAFPLLKRLTILGKIYNEGTFLLKDILGSRYRTHPLERLALPDIDEWRLKELQLWSGPNVVVRGP